MILDDVCVKRSISGYDARKWDFFGAVGKIFHEASRAILFNSLLLLFALSMLNVSDEG